MLDALHECCNQTQLYINEIKLNAVHLRNKSTSLSDTCFNVGAKRIPSAGQYVYLGLPLAGQLDFTIMAIQARSQLAEL